MLGLLNQKQLPVPVIVVGNITLGGTGKTPLVIWLVEYLRSKGYSPCVLSRGYKGKASMWPQQVRPDSDPHTVGDEAILLAEHCKCPVAVSPDRHKGGTALIDHEKCDIVISDDGLQHYSLYRDIEIAVIDGVRRFGNQQLLPAGPLREPIKRLENVDLIVSNGLPGHGEFPMKIVEDEMCLVKNREITRDIAEFSGKTVHAVSGIGNPDRFFYHLKKLNMHIIEHEFPDHHQFTPDDLVFGDELPVIMTEKDAVKCRRFADDRMWFMTIKVEMHEHFGHRLHSLLKEVSPDG